jgi:superfamily II DNA helicase RecQ
MEDQVISLKQHNIAACYLTASQNDPTIWSRALRGEFALVYMYVTMAHQIASTMMAIAIHVRCYVNINRAPERVQSWMDGLRKLVDEIGITAFAIDESHCISEW